MYKKTIPCLHPVARGFLCRQLTGLRFFLHLCLFSSSPNYSPSMKSLPNGFYAICLAVIVASCSNSNTSTHNAPDSTNQVGSTPSRPVSVKEEPVSYTAPDGTNLKGFVAYDESKEGARPVVLVVPEWWGLTDYPRMRAKMLAEMGYLAMAVDMYGNGAVADNPDAAGKEAGAFYANPNLGNARLDAAWAKLKAMPQADTTKSAAIGYCFGGSMVLNWAKTGAPLKGAVSFHGDLRGVPPQKGNATRFLICHGAADEFVPQQQVDAFRKSMDSAGINYTFKAYEGATHAFTNPAATAKGEKFKMPIRYNGAADTASWNEMKAFFSQVLK